MHVVSSLSITNGETEVTLEKWAAKIAISPTRRIRPSPFFS
jgi:hypothetical protein